MPDLLTVSDRVALQMFNDELRAPATFSRASGSLVATWDPPLSPAEQQAADDIMAVARTARPMTSAQYAAVRQQMQTLRALRQMGRNAFLGLTAAERDRQLYDAFTATTTVLLAILRDE